MENWIAACIGKMHVNGIKQGDVADEMGIRRDYLNKILNGKETPKGIEDRVSKAIDTLIARRRNANG